MWGYLKDRVYADKPSTTEELKIAIKEEVSRVPAGAVNRAVMHLKDVRLPLVMKRRGAHFEHLL